MTRARVSYLVGRVAGEADAIEAEWSALDPDPTAAFGGLREEVARER